MAKDVKRKSFSVNVGPVYARHGSGGAIYGLGFLGSLVYYISTAPDLWAGILGIVKSIFWPAFLVHGLLKLIGA